MKDEEIANLMRRLAELQSATGEAIDMDTTPAEPLETTKEEEKTTKSPENTLTMTEEGQGSHYQTMQMGTSAEDGSNNYSRRQSLWFNWAKWRSHKPFIHSNIDNQDTNNRHNNNNNNYINPMTTYNNQK